MQSKYLNVREGVFNVFILNCMSIVTRIAENKREVHSETKSESSK